MSAPTLLTGAQVRVERPRALRYGEVLNHLHDLREADRDWEEVGTGDHTSYEPVSSPPSVWVAMIEAAAQQGLL